MIRKILRTFSPVILVVYFFSFALPAFGQQASYLVSAPSNVTRGDSFDLVITPVNTALDLNSITVSLPQGLSAMPYPVTSLPNGGYDYRILTGSYTGTFQIVVTIANPGGTPTTISQLVTVNPTFFDTWGPLILWGSVILIVAFSFGSGSSGYSHY